MPFDVAHYRYVSYSTHMDGPAKAIEDLKNALTARMFADSDTGDSLVYDVFPDLEVKRGDAHEPGVMPWEHYWQRITDITSRLMINTRNEIAYRPDVVLGISNRGMIFADLLARNFYLSAKYERSSTEASVYQKSIIPVWALWANRDAKSETETFDSIPNDALLESIPTWLSSKGSIANKPNVLLVDDIVATGFTSLAAYKYVTSKFGKMSFDVNVHLLPLFNKDIDHNFNKIGDILIWNLKHFQYDINEIKNLQYSAYQKLPYLKDLR